MVASEMLPHAKSGGLADVLAGLSGALGRLGHDVDVVMPRYRGIAVGEPLTSIVVPLGGQAIDAQVFASVEGRVRTVFIDHAPSYDREYLYGASGHDYADNPARFALLSAAALQWAFSTGLRYDIVHAHDWQAGLVPVLLGRVAREQPGLARVPAVFTIHNLAYQGLCDASWLLRLGLGWDLMHVDAMEYWGRISYLKAGIVFSRIVTTVSPRYAREIQTPEFGFGFDGILRQRSSDLVGILNGIDYDQWSPEHDPNLPQPFSASKLEGKAAAKRKVLDTFGLRATGKPGRRPLVAMISRMVEQKGFDLLAEIADDLPGLGARLVVLGTGERRYEDAWLDLAARYPDRIAARIGFDEGLAHLIEGGADLFLMPSKFEPCGLNQMYSLRYGTVPLVRATGGLADTVQDFDPLTGQGTGFTFEAYSPQALLDTLRRALKTFEDRDTWRALQVAGMSRDFSWDASAHAYAGVYERALSGRG
jgi:starch synthase